jgi:hypothetical protein
MGFPGIGRTAEGAPDFAGTEYLYPAGEGQTSIVTIELTGSYAKDSALAYTESGIAPLGDGWSWHHLDDFDSATGMGTLQLVQRSAHEATYPHYGGAGQFRDSRGWGY